MTPDSQSQQVIHRQIFKIHFFKKPIIWRILKNVSTDAIEEFDDMLVIHFRESSVKFL